MITLLRANETVAGYTIRAWTGPATDEGVGLIAMLEVADPGGRPVCRFEEYLDASVQRARQWPRDEHEAIILLQERALDRARLALNEGTLPSLNGHRFDIS
jgi:hypothetical protein